VEKKKFQVVINKKIPVALYIYLIYKFTTSVTELGSVTDGRPGPARKKRDSEKKWDSDFDEPGRARHGTVTEPGSQVLKIEILKSLRTKRAPGACPNPSPLKVHLDPGSQVLKVEVLKT